MRPPALPCPLGAVRFAPNQGISAVPRFAEIPASQFLSADQVSVCRQIDRCTCTGKKGDIFMAQANNGDTVRIHYSGKLNDGSEFDSSRNAAVCGFAPILS